MSRDSRFRRLLASLSPSSNGRTTRRSQRRQRRLTLESLETRKLLATINVTTFLDVVNSTDNVTSLREAVIEANNNNQAGTIKLGSGTYELNLTGIDNGAAVGDLDIIIGHRGIACGAV